MTIHTVTIRKGRKYDQVLMGARSVFMACGYGDANMDEVARTAKVSKATVYSYFPDNKVCSSKSSKPSVNTWQNTQWKKSIKARISVRF